MMMNGRVEIGRDAGVGGGIVDERLVRLHRTLKRIAKARAHLDLQEAEALREAQRLQLWRQFGHVSLADYMIQELGYVSHRIAEERLRVANALPDLPRLSEAIENGEINFSQARELVRVVTPETEQAWLGKAKEMNVREVEQAVAGHAKGDLPEDPVDPKLVRKTMWLRVRPETEVMFREAKRALEKERGEKLDEDAVMEALCRALLVAGRAKHPGAWTDAGSRQGRLDADSVPRMVEQDSVPRADVDSVPRTVEQVSVPRADVDSVPRADVDSVPRADVDSLPHADVDSVPRTDPDSAPHAADAQARARPVELGSDPRGAEAGSRDVRARAAPYRVAVTVCRECKRGWQHGAGVVEEMTPAAVERAQCDAQWIGDLDSDEVERARQEIPPATRRKVLHRDQGRCQVPGCRCYDNLDIHHIVHREHGGTNELSNLTTLCEAHHLCHHEGTLGIARVGDELVFRREGRNNFTRASREVMTRRALHARKFSREQIAEIMRRTVTHVGRSDLSEEQWLAVALRYSIQVLAPRPATSEEQCALPL